MYSNRPIICFSSNDWNDIPSSKFHIMRHMGQSRTVLYIETIGIRQPKVSSRDAKRVLQKVKVSVRGLKNIEARIHIWSPIAIPFHKYKAIRQINSLYITKIIRRIMSKLDMKNPIMWSYLPNAIDVIRRLNGLCVVYHCIDDYGEFTDAPKREFEMMEREMLQRAALTVVSSRQLLALKHPYCKNIIYIPHGVDLKGFQHQLKNKIELADIDSVKGPIAGFVGRIADWIDLELAARCACELKEWNFVFVGPSNIDLSHYRRIPNMIFLGKKDHKLIPHYINRFDVCLMPFVRNKLVASVNPLKMYEYLAVGKPVVSSPMREIEDYAGVVAFAAPSDFCSAIKEAYETDSLVKRESRMAAVSGRSWESIADEIMRTLDGLSGSYVQ